MNKDTNVIIDNAVEQVFQEMGIESVQIKSDYYTDIIKELESIADFFTISARKKKKGFQYSKDYGFNSSLDYAYNILTDTSKKNIVYSKLNKILSYFRGQQEIDYSIYIKDLNGQISRIHLTGEEAKEFTEAAWNTTFFNSYKTTGPSSLKKYAQELLKKTTQSKILSNHINAYFDVLNDILKENKLSMKDSDKYEAFEYHYQKKDIGGTYNHGFNRKGIKSWIKQRGTHDVQGWYQKGDIGLTSVKSIDLYKNEKIILLTIAKDASLEEVFTLLEELFISQINSDKPSFGEKEISRIIKAFTPAVDELKKNMSVDIKSIVKELIQSISN